MQSDASLSWLALALTPGLASRLSARVRRRFDSPDGVFRGTLPDLESGHLPAQVAKAIVKKESFKRAEKKLTGVQKIAGCYLLNWTEPEYPQTLLQIYDPPVLLYVRGDPQVLNLPSLIIVGTRRPTFYGTQMAQRLGKDLAVRGLVSSAEWPAGLMPSDIRERWMPTAARSECSAQASTSAIQRKTKSCTRKCWSAARLSVNFRCARTPHPKICRHATRSGGGGRRAVQR
jgi:DNA recombination-mediator protein A